jgi:hypothetical protein
MKGRVVTAVEHLSVDDFLGGKFSDVSPDNKRKKQEKKLANSSGTALSRFSPKC